MLRNLVRKLVRVLYFILRIRVVFCGGDFLKGVKYENNVISFLFWKYWVFDKFVLIN